MDQTQYGGGSYADPKDKDHVYYPSVGNPGSFGLLGFQVDPATGRSRLTEVLYRYPDPLNDVISYGGYPTKPIFFPNDAIPLGSHGGTAPGQTFYHGGHQYFTNSYNGYWYNQSPSATLWILENGVCRPIAAAGWVGNNVHRWEELNRPEIKALIPQGKADAIFYTWSDLNHDHAVQPEEVQFTVPPVPGGGGVVFQPDLSIISGGPYHLPTSAIDDNGVPRYDFSKLDLVSKTAAIGETALSPDGWFIVDNTGYRDGQVRWTLPTSKTKTPPTGPGDLKDPKRMLGFPVKSATGEAGYMVARYSYMGEIYLYSVDGLFVTTLGADIRSAPLWPYAEQKLGMDVTGLSFDPEQFWPFMFGLDDGKVYVSAGKWHTSVMRIDGLNTVKRIALGTVELTPAAIVAAAPMREMKAVSETLREEISVPELPVIVDGKIAEWPEKGWAPINAHTAFQMAVNGDKLVVAYRTDQPDLLRNAASEFPFAFTQGGGLDLMLRTTGSDQTRNILAGDIRLFVTKRNGQVLAVLYRQKALAAGASQTFSSPVGQVEFDDVKDISADVQVASNGSDYEFSVPLSVLGLTDSP